MLCVYDCGNEAKYQLKNGKWCCSKSSNSCPINRKKNSISNIGKIITIETRMKLRDYNLGKIYSEESRKKRSLKRKNTIEKILSKYQFFSKLEEMRYNPKNLIEKEIQVHCKNHNCSNSKEKGGWFTPTFRQLSERIRQTESIYGNYGSYFYCSQKCKDECPIYGSDGTDPFRTIEKNYTQKEYYDFRKFVLERDKYVCQFCGEKAFYVHHERPQKLEPFFSLDPDYAWSCCKKCHYSKGHKNTSECSTGNLANKKCK
jgi:hypothetical protein